MPSWRANDVVYFNAADFAFPMTWNLFSSEVAPDDRDRIASIIVSGFQGIFSDSCCLTCATPDQQVSKSCRPKW